MDAQTSSLNCARLYCCIQKYWSFQQKRRISQNPFSLFKSNFENQEGISPTWIAKSTETFALNSLGLLEKHPGTFKDTVEGIKKCPNLKMSYIFEKWSDFDNIFGEDQVFFCTYFQVHRTHFERATSKNLFFHFFQKC